MVAAGLTPVVLPYIYNIAMTIGLPPITGLPLPLMSYSGSFMISTLVALGIIQSVPAPQNQIRGPIMLKKSKNLNSTDRHKKEIIINIEQLETRVRFLKK